MLVLLSALAAAAPCFVVSGDIRTADGPIDAVSFDPETGLILSSSQAVGCTAIVPPSSDQARVITAGFVAVGTRTGLTEVGAVSATNQTDAGGDNPIRSSLVVTESYNPMASHIAVTRMAGVTDAVVLPSGGLVAGQGGWVRLTGETQSDSIVDASVAMVGGRDGHMSRTLRVWRQLFDDADYLKKNRGVVDRGTARPLSAHPADLRALWPVMSGELPLMVGVDRASDIESLLTFIADTELSVVIDGGAEAWRHADALAAADVAVLLDPTVYGPGGFDQLQGRPDNAKLLADAGVKIMLGHMGTHNARLVAHQAGIAVGQGLSAEQALTAVTTTPREVFGVGGGALTAGTPATFVVWESVTSEIATYPFEPTTRAVAVYIDGVAQDMNSRQTDLRDRYIGLPGSPLVPLTPQ